MGIRGEGPDEYVSGLCESLPKRDDTTGYGEREHRNNLKEREQKKISITCAHTSYIHAHYRPTRDTLLWSLERAPPRMLRRRLEGGTDMDMGVEAARPHPSIRRGLIAHHLPFAGRVSGLLWHLGIIGMKSLIFFALFKNTPLSPLARHRQGTYRYVWPGSTYLLTSYRTSPSAWAIWLLGFRLDDQGRPVLVHCHVSLHG